MKELVEFIVKKIVTKPDSITIEQVTEGEVVKINIKVSPDDVGRVIGKKGATINSIRTLVKAASVKEGLRTEVDVIEESSN